MRRLWSNLTYLHRWLRSECLENISIVNRLAQQSEKQIANRLRSLASMGLAKQVSPTEWMVRGNYADVLRTMQHTSDRQKTLAQHQSLASDPRLQLQVEDWRGLGNLDPHTEIDAARRDGRLVPNSFVSMQRTRSGGRITHKLEHFGDADALLSNRQFLESRTLVPKCKRIESTKQKSEQDAKAGPLLGGGLGRYKLALERVRSGIDPMPSHQAVPPAKMRGVERDFIPAQLVPNIAICDYSQKAILRGSRPVPAIGKRRVET